MRVVVWWLAACHRDRAEDSDSGGTHLDSGTTPAFVLGCRPHPENDVRALCGFERDGAGPISVVLTGAGEPPKTFAGDPDLLVGEIVGWDLLADTAWGWEIVDRGEVVDQGTLVTDSLKPGYAPTTEVLVDGPTGVDRQLFSLSCGRGPTLFVTDALGRVRWYEDVGEHSFISGFVATDHGTVAAVMDRDTVGEWPFAGAPPTFYTNPGALPFRVHHTLTSEGDALYALDIQVPQLADGKVYLVDGLSEIRAGVATHVWDTLQIVDPLGLPGDNGAPYWLNLFPTAIDFAHTNSVDVQPDGSWLMSLKHLDSVVHVNVDGSLRWVARGELNTATFYGPDLALTSHPGVDASFQHPHDVSMTPWGTVLLFDNGNPPNGVDLLARVVELAVDEQALTGEVVRAWDLGVTCPVQSSAFPLADGSLLASCAATRMFFELDDDGIRRQTRVGCNDGGAGTSFVRVQPLDWSSATAR